MAERDPVVIPVAQEEAHVSKWEVETGVVRVRKLVREHVEEIDEPLRHDEVDIEHIAVMQRQWVLREEIRLRRRAVQTRHRERVALREEQVTITEAVSTPRRMQMAKTVVGLMDNIDEAQSLVRGLVASGIERSDIGFMANQKQEIPSSAGLNESEGSRSDAGTGALAGAGAGAAFGGLAGLLLSVAPLAIPGIGPIIAAGPIAAALTGAGIGAVAGGLIGGLTNLGVPEEEAHYYAEGVRRGGILVTVAAESDTQADKAAGIMRQHGAVDIDQRATEWKKQGWAGRFQADTEAQGERTIPVTQEELAVGRREVSQGGVRVYARVSEQPVRKSVEDTVRRTDVEVQRTSGSTSGSNTYNGPERRMKAVRWTGGERRRAA